MNEVSGVQLEMLIGVVAMLVSMVLVWCSKYSKEGYGLGATLVAGVTSIAFFAAGLSQPVLVWAQALAFIATFLSIDTSIPVNSGSGQRKAYWVVATLYIVVMGWYIVRS